jgi:hypothetical protein
MPSQLKSVTPNKINLGHCCFWLVVLQK